MLSPIITAVIAAYEIEDYADALFRSIEGQTISPSDIEIIVVDDGSRDLTLEKARSWASRSRFDATIVTQENSGVAAARNRGIGLAKGEWIAFVDSDDVLDKEYFEALFNFIHRDAHKSASMLTSRSLIFNEEKGIAQDIHPLGWKYRRGDRLVSLSREPHVIHLGGHSTIVKSSVVRRHQIRFSSDVRPAFEDAHFIGTYLGKFEEPVIGLVASARYYYRKRANGSSLIDTTWTKPEKFTHEPKFGHLALLESLKDSLGQVPEWAQNMVLYSLYWYFRADRQLNSPLKGISQELFDEFWETLYKIFELIDESTIRRFNIVNYGWALKEGILRHFKGTSIIPNMQNVAYMWNADDIKRNTRKIGYTFTGEKPSEKIFTDGSEFTGAISKSIRHESFGRTLMFEQVIVLPRVRHVDLYLNGSKVRIVKPTAAEPLDTSFKSNPKHLQLSVGTYTPTASELVRRAKGSNGYKKAIVGAKAVSLKIKEESWINGDTTIRSSVKLGNRIYARYTSKRKTTSSYSQDKSLVRLAHSPHIREKYRDAWIIIDHPARADDNGEHFYRYMAEEQPHINIFFMIKASSDDWTRLSQEGFRLIAYGSDEAVLVTLNAKYIISSHIDAGIYDPVSKHRFGPSPARRIFLQHGMVMNDLSNWLNTKGLALMVSSSPSELEHFVGDGSKYKFTHKEVSLTGLPRHDTLAALSYTPLKERKFISFVPTWRQGLTNSINAASSFEEKRSLLHSSEFYKAWHSVTHSARIQKTAENSGAQIVFVLHDHMAAFKELFEFESHVKLTSFKEVRVQEFLVNSKVVVTDYSSIATEAAIAGAAVSYFQFDKALIYSAGHTFSPGWFDYDEDGFGPVLITTNEVERWISSRARLDWSTPRKYRARLNSTLPVLDGTASLRVFSAIEELDKPVFE